MSRGRSNRPDRGVARAYDRKRDAESDTRPLYKTARWQRMRLRQLFEQPNCARCSTPDHPVSANVAHHIVPHKGDIEAFWNNHLESVCDDCHNIDIQAEERGGKARQKLDADGWNVS